MSGHDLNLPLEIHLTPKEHFLNIVIDTIMYKL